jgi:uncharacterized protein YndB with AHSA1/START domain
MESQMMSSSHEDAGPAAFSFSTAREFLAPRELLFRVWTDAMHLKQWLAPRGCEVLSFKCDARPGGMAHYQQRGHGGMAFWGRWQFRAVAPPARLEFLAAFSDAESGLTRNPWQAQWPLQMLSVVEFTEHDGRTTVTVQAAAYESTAEEAQAFAEGADSMRQGWSGTFDNLAQYLAGLEHGAA